MALFSWRVFLFMLFHQYFGLVAQNDLAALVDGFDTHRQHSPSGVPRGALVLDLHFRVQRVARPHRHLEDERIHAQPGQHVGAQHRSEEHTSELQSLMRISYAVFCLKKKKKNTTSTMKDYNTNNKHTQQH